MKLKNRPGQKMAQALVLAIFLIAGSFSASAQDTNAPAQTDYQFFSVIADRNIFDPNRYAHATGSRPAESSGPQTPGFALVGTMSYRKGTFAFFDGTSAEYRKVLERNGSIAGYKVAEIAPDAVTLEAAGRQIQMKVGEQMRQDTQGAWALAAGDEVFEDSTPGAPEDSGASSGSDGATSDVLKKLMQQREQELK